MKVLGEIDLDDLLTQPSSTFYRFLKKIKKEVFEDDERIILRAHGKLPPDLVDHIKWTLNYVDVPEFFLILETNIESIPNFILLSFEISLRILIHSEFSKRFFGL